MLPGDYCGTGPGTGLMAHVRCMPHLDRNAEVPSDEFLARTRVEGGVQAPMIGRGDDTVGNPHRTQIYKLDVFELIILSKLDKQFSIERFEPTVSQSTVPSPPLK